MANITNSSPVVTEDKLKDFYEDIKPFLGCPAYVTQEGDAEYYSTDEKVIGRWHDGKPLYQRVLTGTTPSNNTNTIVLTLDSSIRTKNLFGWSGSVPIPYYGNTSWYLNAYMEGGYTLRMQVNGYNSMPFELVIQYTKETDSAVTTTEQKPTHYSTDEQVVGTWIDGKPLYQKTVYMEASYLDASTDGVKQTNKKAHNINNIKNIISCDAKLMFNLSGDKSGSSNLPFLADVTIINDNPVPLNVLAWADKTNICIDTSVSNMSTWNDSVYFTLQYVKTTD